ncbi:arylsulfatase [Nocardioides marinquilinus]|uniref:Arylsulfatase n=1 Tax=Nocardioides marinquilinus TaxID=1210400 RepID=A0ABP9Q6F8_9ACTN
MTSRTLPRRSVLSGLAATAVAGTAATTTTSSAAQAVPAPSSRAPRGRKGRPNILLVVVDDLGRGEVGAYGQQVLQTPVLDRLAADGIRFDQAYATPTCAPTRCSLFTGQHTGHATVKTNADAGRGLSRDDVTIPEVLGRAGYRTGLIGKWGLGPERAGQASHPTEQGFDRFFGYINQSHCHDYWPTYLWDDETTVIYSENHTRNAVYAGTLITEQALAFLDDAARRDQPFFLDVSYTTPHAPNVHIDEGPYGDQDWPDGEKAHAAQVTWTDAQVGLLLERLEQRGLADDTVVVFVSDNGPHEAGANYDYVNAAVPHDADFFDSNGGLRGIKRDVYEGGIRVPMIARVPGTPGGRVVTEPIAVWDLLPTFAELGRARTPRGLDGISFAAALQGRAQRAHDHLYWSFDEGRFDEAVRFGRWKAVRLGGRAVELYDLETDEAETTDVAAQHPDLVRRAEQLMAQAVA